MEYDFQINYCNPAPSVGLNKHNFDFLKKLDTKFGIPYETVDVEVNGKISQTEQGNVYDIDFKPSNETLYNITGTYPQDILCPNGVWQLAGCFYVKINKETVLFGTNYSHAHVYFNTVTPLMNLKKSFGNNPDINNNVDFISEEVKKQMPAYKNCVLMTSHGTLIKKRLSREEKNIMRNFKETAREKTGNKGTIILLSGWNFDFVKDKLKKNGCDPESDPDNVEYLPNAIVTEGGHCLNIYDAKKKTWVSKRLIDDLKPILEANYTLLDVIFEKYPNAVLMSQGNIDAICYYVNPPTGIIKEKL